MKRPWLFAALFLALGAGLTLAVMPVHYVIRGPDPFVAVTNRFTGSVTFCRPVQTETALVTRCTTSE